MPPGLVVHADPRRIGQALVNLVDNAVRHGAPPVRMSAERRDGEVVLHVADAGTGFDPRTLPGAFERPAAGRAGGFRLGLGLGLVAAIARAHRGSAGAGAAVHGAAVWLTLPAPEPGHGGAGP